MVFWAEEIIKLATEISDKMEAINAPKNENGEYIAGTPEVIQFNQYVFALMRATAELRKAME